jgi:hypothetical protein
VKNRWSSMRPAFMPDRWMNPHEHGVFRKHYHIDPCILKFQVLNLANVLGSSLRIQQSENWFALKTCIKKLTFRLSFFLNFNWCIHETEVVCRIRKTKLQRLWWII